MTFESEVNEIVENNLAGIDGMAFILNTFGYPDFVTRLLGIARKFSPKLTSGCSEDSSWCPYDIKYEKSGDLISKIDLIDEDGGRLPTL